MKHDIYLAPGDRVRCNRTGKEGIIQWIDWDRSEVSVYMGASAYLVTPLEEITGLIQRVMKPISEMSVDEMKLELDLLRESRKVAITASRTRRKRSYSNPKSKAKAESKPTSNPLDFLSPEQRALLQAKLNKKKGEEGDGE